MDKLIKQEIFKIEMLYWLRNKGFLSYFLFGGESMLLRLCYVLNRYPVDLDFWFYRVSHIEKFFYNLKKSLEKDYELTDAKNKHCTLLFEIKKSDYPRRLKIEIRKSKKNGIFKK